MENKIIEKKNLLERITSIILQKKKIFIIITILIIASAFSLFFFNYYENIKTKEVSEKYIKAGIYTGNGDDDGTFVYTGFRPAMMIIREVAVDDWGIYDDQRLGWNASTSGGNAVLYPNASYAEGTEASRAIDILSNGFKLRTSNATFNASGGNYIYLAMAHNPFQYATAR